MCSEAPQGATIQDPCSSEASGTATRREEHLSPCSPSSENLEVLAEVSTLDLQNRNKNHSGTAKKQVRKARLAEAPVGEAAGGQPQQGPQKQGLRLRTVRLRPCRSPVHLAPDKRE